MWAALDVFVGLALCYALVSLFCSVVQEFIAQALNSRGRLLVEALKAVRLEELVPLMRPDLVANPGNVFRTLMPSWGSARTATPATANAARDLEAAKQVARAIRNEGDARPLAALGEQAASAGRLPFDIPVDVFVSAVLHKLRLAEAAPPQTGGDAHAQGRQGAGGEDGAAQNASPGRDLAAIIEDAALPPALGQRLLLLAARSQDSLDAVRKEIAEWYAGFVAQVEHWYTRRSQAVSLVIALIAAAAFNVDTFRIARDLYADPQVREKAVEAATRISGSAEVKACGTAEKPAGDPRACYAAIKNTSPLPLGWDFSAPFADFWHVVLATFGIVVSGLAISLGARFWFDTLKSLLAFRTGGQPAPASSTRDRPAS